MDIILKDDPKICGDYMHHLYEVKFPYNSTLQNIDPTKCYQLLSYRQPVNVEQFKLVVGKQGNFF